MYEVGVVTQFEAAHRLSGDFGPASRLHGHTYRVEVALRGDELREDGTLCDIGELRRVVDSVVGQLDYRELDEIEGLTGHNTTAEAVARYLFTQITPWFASSSLTLVVVRVWESPQAYASFEGPLD